MRSYVCVLSTDNYLDGVLILNENLKMINSKYPLLCLINDKISNDSIKMLEGFNINYKKIEHINYEHSNFDNDYWKYTFDKLSVFRLIEYEKVVYLDSDLLILENIDNLFKEENLTMPLDLPFKPKGHNTGIMVIKPNENDFKKMIKMVHKSNNEGKQISDQDIINEYYKERLIPLTFGYNMVRLIKDRKISCYNEVNNWYSNRYEVIKFLKESEYNKIIHYIGKTKPFMLDDFFNDKYSELYFSYARKIRRKKIKLQEKKSRLSIIIPIYNKEQTLRRCLDSILYQTHENIEIILIDDNSTDLSFKICEEYSQKNDKIILIKQEKNKGVSSTRNLGLKVATGDYITFIDADDYIDLNAYENILNYLIRSKVDFIQCGTIINDKKIEYCQNEEAVCYGNDQVTIEFLNKNISGTIWDKIYTKELINNLKFREEYSKNEDSIFLVDVVKRANSFMRIGFPFYHYYYDDTDTLIYKFDVNKDQNLFEYLDIVKEYINDKHMNLINEYQNFNEIILNYMKSEAEYIQNKSENADIHEMLNEIKKRIEDVSIETL